MLYEKLNILKLDYIIGLLNFVLMESKRQRQIAEVIRRHFGSLLLQEGIYIYGDAFVTVTKVQVSPDISVAKIYLSIYNTENKEEILNKMNDSVHVLKKNLAHRVRRHIRRIPVLSFYNDDTLDEMYRLNKLFDNLHDNKQIGEDE